MPINDIHEKLYNVKNLSKAMCWNLKQLNGMFI